MSEKLSDDIRTLRGCDIHGSERRAMERVLCSLRYYQANYRRVADRHQDAQAENERLRGSWALLEEIVEFERTGHATWDDWYEVWLKKARAELSETPSVVAAKEDEG